MKSVYKNQDGLISIISTIIIIVIITVVTLSLSVLSRRELRQAIDEQLSSQALYAAESGVNDAIKKLYSAGSDRITTVSSCDDSKRTFLQSSLGGDVRYTCVLVTDAPGEIITEISKGSMKSYPLDSGTAGFSELNFEWSGQNSESSGDCSAADKCFTDAVTWSDKIGLLRVRLFKASDFTLAKDIVAYPGKLPSGTGSGTTVIGGSVMLYGDCSSDAKKCSVKINGTLDSKYYAQLYSYYGDVKVKVNGKDLSGGTVAFIGAQTSIDATGAAGDVLKRIKVTVPSAGYANLSPYVLSSAGDICKRFTSNLTATNNSNDASSCNPF